MPDFAIAFLFCFNVCFFGFVLLWVGCGFLLVCMGVCCFLLVVVVSVCWEWFVFSLVLICGLCIRI